jgi:hypothetical protein
MNTTFHIAAALAACVLTAGCERAATPASGPESEPVSTPATPAAAPAAPVSEPIAPAGMSGFRHDASLDLFGYYMPEGEVKFGKWRLDTLHVGTLDDLAKYERGDRDPPQYAPVLIELADTTSPTATNELGGEYHTNQKRILPLAYEVSGTRIAFSGKDPELGDVRFEGTLDSAAVKRAAAAQAEGAAGPGVVLTGRLSVGTETRDVKFTWFGGD